MGRLFGQFFFFYRFIVNCQQRLIELILNFCFRSEKVYQIYVRLSRAILLRGMLKSRLFFHAKPDLTLYVSESRSNAQTNGQLNLKLKKNINKSHQMYTTGKTYFIIKQCQEFLLFSMLRQSRKYARTLDSHSRIHTCVFSPIVSTKQ